MEDKIWKFVPCCLATDEHEPVEDFHRLPLDIHPEVGA
jgi:hypothetical protein